MSRFRTIRPLCQKSKQHGFRIVSNQEGKCWKLHLQKRKKSGRGLDGLEWLLWQFYRSTDDIFTEDGAESFPRWTPCFRFNPDHFFFCSFYETVFHCCEATAARQQAGSQFFSTQTENLGWTDSNKTSLVDFECKVQKLVSFYQGLLFPRFFSFERTLPIPDGHVKKIHWI